MSTPFIDETQHLDNLTPLDLKQRLILLENQLRSVKTSRVSTNAQLEEILLQEEIEACSRHLFPFYQAAWPIYEGSPFLSTWHMEAMCEALEAVFRGDIQKLILQVPPGCGKSSLCNVAFPAWVWTKDPSTRFMTPSVTDRLSLRDSTRTRDVIQSKWYQDNWGHNFKLDPNVNQKSFWRNNKNGYRLAGGLRGQGIGERFDIGICDDPHKPTEIADSKMKEFVWDWYTGLFSMREAPGGNAKQIIIHQRLATDDLIGRLLEAEPGEWEVLSFPMEFELGQYYTWSDTNILPSRDPRTEQGELLCPQIHDRKAVNTKKKLLGPYGAAAQLQQRPINLEGGIIKSKWLKDYLVGNKTIFLKSMNIIVGSWDLSFGATGNSYCVGQVWGLRNGGEKYLIDQYRGKWEYPQQKAAIKQMLEEYPQIRTLLVEKKANGSAMLSSLERDIRNLRIRNINLIPVEVNKSKEIRLYMCLSDFEAGNVYVPINTQNDKPWTHEYVQELINFPVAKNDDMVDTTTMVLNWFAQNSGLLRQIVMDSEDYKFLQKQDLELQLRPVGRDLVFESSSTRNLFTFTEEQLNLPYF